MLVNAGEIEVKENGEIEHVCLGDCFMIFFFKPNDRNVQIGLSIVYHTTMTSDLVSLLNSICSKRETII